MPQTRKLIATPMELNWPYKRHFSIFKGIQDYGKQHGDWLFDPGNHPESALARGERFDGIVGRITPECLKAARKASIPVVNVWVESPVSSQVPEVHVDHQEAGRIATEHLIARGFKRIAYFGIIGATTAARQYQGVQEMASKYGYRYSRHLVSRHWDANQEALSRLEDAVLRAQAGWEGPIGVVCIADELARAVAMICIRHGWIIPEQLALTGLGNDNLICTAAEPTLTSIAMGYANCGFEAARLLDRLMRGAKPPREITYIPPQEIVVRYSSDMFSVSDLKVAQALRHMAEHSSAPLNVTEIARATGIGRKTLERRFQRHLGHTINEELTRLRIAKLKRLLVDSQTNISELGGQAGFGNFVSMHKMFKRATGMTPGEYRERHGSRPDRTADEL